MLTLYPLRGYMRAFETPRNIPQDVGEARIDGSFRAKWADDAAGTSRIVNQSLFLTA